MRIDIDKFGRFVRILGDKSRDEFSIQEARKMLQERISEEHGIHLKRIADLLMEIEIKEGVRAPEICAEEILYQYFADNDSWDISILQRKGVAKAILKAVSMRPMNLYMYLPSGAGMAAGRKVTASLLMEVEDKEDKEMDNKKFIEICKELVKDYTNALLDKKTNPYITEEDVFVVWSCKTLLNNKALLSTTVSDGMYYELTYNGNKNEIYFDAYKKFENRCIKL